MDIKVGGGAFMRTLERAHSLADSILRVGRAAGLDVSALFTRMDAPLGSAIGNALETSEAFDLLRGGGPDDLLECTLALGAEMLQRAGLARSEANARRTLTAAIESKRALQRMERVVRAQGGDPRVVAEPDRLPNAPRRVQLTAARSGAVRALDALAVGQACVALGAGRARAEDVIDPSVGVVLRKKPGDRVREGEVLAEIHAGDLAAGRRAARAIEAAYGFGASASKPELILGRRR
jgi:thymidine phosphorylase